MLSAKKQEMPKETTPEDSHAQAPSGFGKVLNSIQGLQQRLDDFSIEEAIRAEAKARTLIQQLGLLQAQLIALAKLKRAVVGANQTIAALPEENFDPVSPDNLEKHPELRAIVQTAKLIRMYRLLRAAQVNAESISFDLYGGESNRNPSPRQTAATYEAPDPMAELASEGLRQGVAEVTPAEVIPVEEEPIRQPTESEIAEYSIPIGTEPATEPEHLAPASARNSVTQPIPVHVTYTDLRLEENREAESPRTEDFLIPGKSAAQLTSNRENKNPASKPHFDERLLNDLIETYGEFAFSINSGESAEPAEAGPSEPLEPRPSSAERPLEVMPAEPAFTQAAAKTALALPAPEFDQSESYTEPVLSPIKDRGDIDRQLKRIVRDYGEYDLYSQQKSMNYTTAAIAAFAVLGLVLGGFYFFKAPPPPVPAAVEAVAPRNGTDGGTSDRQASTGEQASRPQQNVTKQRK